MVARSMKAQRKSIHSGKACGSRCTDWLLTTSSSIFYEHNYEEKAGRLLRMILALGEYYLCVLQIIYYGSSYWKLGDAMTRTRCWT